MEIGIEKLQKLLPEGYQAACQETKAMERVRNIKSPEDLLQLELFYLYNSSLVEVGPYAQMCGMEKISDVGFMGRFQKSADWLGWMASHSVPDNVTRYQKPPELEAYRVLAIDASDVYTRGAAPKCWRVHYALNLFTMNCHQFQITEQTEGERLENFTLRKNDLVLADRAYASIQGIEYCRKQGCEFILRIRNKAFHVYRKNEESGEMERVILTDWLKTVGREAKDITLYYKVKKDTYRPLRFCSVKKSEEEIAKTGDRICRKQSKKQITVSEDSKLANHYIIVVTSLPATFTPEMILSLYRLRWQVEMVFKRYKSLLALGSIPVRKKESCRAWLQGKMLLALLIEKFLGNVDFSPSGGTTGQTEHLAGDQVLVSLIFGTSFCHS